MVTKTLIEIDDWKLICLFNSSASYGKLQSVDQKTRDEIFYKTWSLQDGYGKVGYTPSQGWDWSGIRDSSEKARINMAAAIRKILTSKGITSLTFIDIDTRPFKLIKD